MTTKKQAPARKPANYVETFPTADGQFAWHLVARNGNIRCQGEGHPNRANATRAFRGVQLALANVPADIPVFHLKVKP